MPITNSMMPAVNAALATLQASVVAAVDAARDNVKTDVDSKITAARTNINGWTTAAQNNVQSTVNAKGVAKSVQRGQVTVAGATPVDVAVASVNPDKSFLTVSGSRSNTYGAATWARLTSATNIQFATPASNGGVVSWELVELF